MKSFIVNNENIKDTNIRHFNYLLFKNCMFKNKYMYLEGIRYPT